MTTLCNSVGKMSKQAKKKAAAQDQNKKGSLKSVEVQMIESRKVSLKTGKQQVIAPFSEDKNLKILIAPVRFVSSKTQT